jgi:hypothetical protein
MWKIKLKLVQAQKNNEIAGISNPQIAISITRANSPISSTSSCCDDVATIISCKSWIIVDTELCNEDNKSIISEFSLSEIDLCETSLSRQITPNTLCDSDQITFSNYYITQHQDQIDYYICSSTEL